MSKSNVRFAAAVTALLASLVPAAAADSTSAAAAKWGLIGTWALDCSKKPAEGNVYETYARQGNDVFLNRNGGSFNDSNKFLSAKISANGMLDVRIQFTRLSQTRVNVFQKAPDGRKRAVTNHDTKGAYTVKDGKFVGNGAPTQWMTRCH
jgi:hypothetical protein